MLNWMFPLGTYAYKYKETFVFHSYMVEQETEHVLCSG